MKHMPLSRLYGLALRQLLRDLRASEVRVLFFALLVAVAASTAIGYFGARLNGAMQLRASEFLGADLVLQGSAPAREQQIATGTALGLRHAQVIEFTSVVGGDNGIQLSSVKAADAAYHCAGRYAAHRRPMQRKYLVAARHLARRGSSPACWRRWGWRLATAST